MINLPKLTLVLSLSTFALASCANANSGETAATDEQGEPAYTVTEIGEFNEQWAIEFAPGTDMLFITEKAGTLKMMDTANGTVGEVSGAPEVAYGGQGGLGDIAFLPSQSEQQLAGRTIYLSWAEAGDGETYGAAVGRGLLVCEDGSDCRVDGLEVIWRQSLKTGRRGHYSHRITFAPDEQYMFIASGDRQELDPAQDN
ncbi:MAG: PQQ-dependent sugar dehydrogenase, partial [Pseudomonadota bacterium]